MLKYQVGQQLELVEVPHGYDHKELGDRFTVHDVDSDGRGGELLDLLSHKTGRYTGLHAKFVRHVVYNPEPAGAPRGSFNTLQALSTVLQEELQLCVSNPLKSGAVTDVMRDMERARMTMEDFRQGNGPATYMCGKQQWMSSCCSSAE